MIFDGEYVLLSRATNRPVDQSLEIGDIFDTLQNLNPSGLVVRMMDWVYSETGKKTRYLTVSELPAEDFLNASDPFKALITKRSL